jgi:hypothetical protein
MALLLPILGLHRLKAGLQTCWALKGVDHDAAVNAGVIGDDRPTNAAGLDL